MKRTNLTKSEAVGIRAAIVRAIDALKVDGVATAREALDNALAIIGTKANKRPRDWASGRPLVTVEFEGQMVTSRDLAKRAGCTPNAMRQRLERMSVTEALAMGASSRFRAKGPGTNFYRNETGLHPSTKIHTFQGRPATTAELAKLAGCSAGAMRLRLQTMSAEQAVSQVQTRPSDWVHPKSKRYELGGKSLTLRQLAERAGCKVTTMRDRLQNMTPAEAVGLGQADPHRRRTTLQAAAASVPQTKPPSSAVMSAKSWTAVAKKKADMVSLTEQIDTTKPARQAPAKKATKKGAK